MAGILGATPDAPRLDSLPLLAEEVSSKASSNSIPSFPLAGVDGCASGSLSGLGGPGPQSAEQIVAEDLEEAPAACPPPAAAVSLGLDDVGFEKDPRMMMSALDGQVAPVCTGSIALISQTMAFWPAEHEDIPKACTSSDFEGGKHEQPRFSSEELSTYSAAVCASTPNSIIKLSRKYAQDDFRTCESESQGCSHDGPDSVSHRGEADVDDLVLLDTPVPSLTRSRFGQSGR
ncbi:hypothetical protein Nepgr_019604 [Nepenthes gracilis]|uniref:Uncharacterized protein n=1 Tax=Nepenthes gracilis TaxID=150966 RepID=A0AAD3STS9_NEPGR|nr:hypothetical protein Nepgr_019604 [Nepenthes gracilis]